MWIDASGDYVKHSIVKPAFNSKNSDNVRGRQTAVPRYLRKRKTKLSQDQKKSTAEDKNDNKLSNALLSSTNREQCITKPANHDLQNSKNSDDNKKSDLSSPPNSRERWVFKRSDHKLQACNNPEIRAWLKRKNKLLRQQKREERRKLREETLETEKKEKESLERKLKSEKAFRDWNKQKQKHEKLLKKRVSSDSKKIFSEITETRADPIGNVAEFRELNNDVQADQIELVKPVADVSQEKQPSAKEGSNILKSFVPHPPKKKDHVIVENSSRRKDLVNSESNSDKRLSIINLHLDEKDNKTNSRQQLTFEQWLKNKTERSRSRSKTRTKNTGNSSNTVLQSEKPTTLEDKRMSYDAWLQKKQIDDLEKKKKEAEIKELKLQQADPQMAQIVHGLMKTRIQRLRGSPTRQVVSENQDTRTNDKPANHDYPLPLSEQESNHDKQLPFTEQESNQDKQKQLSVSDLEPNRDKQYQWPHQPVQSGEPQISASAFKSIQNSSQSQIKLTKKSSSPNSMSRKADKITHLHVNPFSSRSNSARPRTALSVHSNSARSTTEPHVNLQVSHSNSARSRLEMSSSLSNEAEQIDSTNKQQITDISASKQQTSNRPTLTREGLKQVKYQTKSWEVFSQFVWDKVNEDEDSRLVSNQPEPHGERPEPQGADISQLLIENELKKQLSSDDTKIEKRKIETEESNLIIEKHNNDENKVVTEESDLITEKLDEYCSNTENVV